MRKKRRYVMGFIRPFKKKTGWNKEAWLAYREWAERWERWAIDWYINRLAAEEREYRED